MSHAQPTSVTQGTQFATAYPFTQPSDDLRGLLTDLYLCYLDNSCEIELPLRVDWLFGFGSDPSSPPVGTPTPVNDYEILILDANDLVVFDSTDSESFFTQAWGDRLIIEWRLGRSVCRVVKQDVTEAEWPDTFRPDNGVLDPRAYHQLPRSVTSLTATEQLEPGRVELHNGFNMTITPEEPDRVDGGRRVTRLVFAAEPGSGLGAKPGCGEETEVVIRRINGIGPDSSGNFVFDAKDCFRVQLPVTVTNQTAEYGGNGLGSSEAQHAIVLFNDCAPCCECIDYVNTYKGLKGVWNAWKAVAEKLSVTRDLFAQNRTRWQEAVQCALEDPISLRLIQDKACAAQVSASFCNTTSECIEPVVMTFTFSGPDDGTVIEAQWQGSHTGGRQKATLEGAWPVFFIEFPKAEPQSIAWVNFRVCMSGCEEGEEVEVTLTVEGQTASASANTTLTTDLPSYGCGCAAEAPLEDGRLIPVLEVPSGLVNGVNDTFELGFTPDPAESLQVFWNGVLQVAGTDFDITGTTIVFAPAFIPQPGDTILVYYLRRT